VDVHNALVHCELEVGHAAVDVLDDGDGDGVTAGGGGEDVTTGAGGGDAFVMQA